MFSTKISDLGFPQVGNDTKMIALEIGVHASTISIGLGRNIAKRGRTSGIYVASNAQRKTDQDIMTFSQKIRQCRN